MLANKSLLVLTPEYAPYTWGGLATYLHSVVPLLAARGVGVDVVVSPTYVHELSPSELVPPPVPAIGTIDSGLPVDVQLSAFDEFAGTRYDTVYVQDQALTHVAIALKREGRCDRIVAAAHLPSYSGFSYFDRPLDSAREQAGEALLFRHSDVVIVPSRFVADTLLRVHRLSPADIRVIALGAPFAPKPRRTPAGSLLDVCVVARIAKQKGLRQLREVVDGTPPGIARFTLIGRELRAEDRATLEECDIEMVGQLSHAEVLKRLNRADILLSTSLHETFGLAVLEAMTCGAVPIAFECGALPELISSGVDGYLVAIGDTQAMIDLLCELAGDRASLERRRTSIVEKVSGYSWPAHADALTVQLFPV